MISFRRLIMVVLLTGLISGLALFFMQRLTLVPLINEAEVYEDAAEHAHPEHTAEEWKPAEGLQRDSLTALGSILTGVAFAALLLGLVSAAGCELDFKRGLLGGTCGFLCVTLAPALGLPPQPPGTPVADISARQFWWVATVAATLIGMLLIVVQSSNWWKRIAGSLLIAAPHLLGAPVAVGKSVVPMELVHRFSFESVLCMAVFWLILGTLGGYFTQRLRNF